MTQEKQLAVGSMELPVLSPDAAKGFIADMLVELCIIAENAKLRDMASTLQLTINSVEIMARPQK